MMRRKSVYRFQAETLAYRALIESEEGTISAASLKAVDAFVKSCKESKVWDQLADVGVFAGNQLAAALCKLKSTNGAAPVIQGGDTFGGEYAENVGLTGDGETLLDTDVVINTVLGTRASGGLVVYTSSAIDDVAAGTLLGSNSDRIFTDGALASFHWGGDGRAFVSVAPGFYSGQIRAGKPVETFYGNSLEGSGGDTGNAADDSLFLLSDGDVNFFTGVIGFYAVTQGLTDSQNNSLFVAVQALQTALGRAV